MFPTHPHGVDHNLSSIVKLDADDLDEIARLIGPQVKGLPGWDILGGKVTREECLSDGVPDVGIGDSVLAG